MFLAVPQHKFLSNTKNKVSFIALLADHLRINGINVFQAEGDADRTIVMTGVRRGENSVIVGEDTDLLVLIALAPPEMDVLLLMPKKDIKDSKIFSSQALQLNLNAAGNLAQHVLFPHAMSGCDST